MRRKLLILAVLFVLLLMLPTVVTSSKAQVFSEVKQLTKNDFDEHLGSGGYAHDHILSWDGGKMVFSTKYSEFDWKLYLMNTSDSPREERLMANAPGCNVWGSISADGDRVVFGSNRDEPSNWWYGFEIFVMNTEDDPGDEVQITRDRLLDHMPDISGNGEMVAWHSAPNPSGGFDIKVANVSDMSNIDPQELTTTPEEDECPSLTYSGVFLSFWGGTGHSGDVYHINSDGTELRNLTEELSGTTPEQSCAISGDGTRVAFPRTVDGDMEIFVYDIAEDKPIRLTDNDADDILGGINGDGTMVTYSRNGDIFVHNLTAETQLTDGDSNDKWPRISGDGSTIVFMSNRDGPDYDLFMIHLDVRQWEHIFEDPCRGTTLKISTDDKYFQFTAPDKEYAPKHAAKMSVCSNMIFIWYGDEEITLFVMANTRYDYCFALAVDRTAGKAYLLVDRIGLE